MVVPTVVDVGIAMNAAIGDGFTGATVIYPVFVKLPEPYTFVAVNATVYVPAAA
jgi:hypothetical protein